MNIDEKFELINVTVEISWSFVEPREGAHFLQASFAHNGVTYELTEPTFDQQPAQAREALLEKIWRVIQ